MNVRKGTRARSGVPGRTGRMCAACAVLLAASAGARASEAAVQGRAGPPNIVLVLSDDVGLSRIGCYGGAPFRTPNLDRLAAAGVRFERCYSMPLCGPSRAALLTGKYPFRTGALDNDSSVVDPAKHATMAHLLRRAGYATCAIGKLGQSAPENDAAAPAALGFDEYMLWMGRATPDRYWSPRYHRNGEVVQRGPGEYGPDLTHEFLVDFMKRNRARPFFVYYSAVLAHVPLARTPDSRSNTTDGAAVLVDMVAYLDKLMGRLAADLDALGLRDRTLLLFTSDNGPQGSPAGTVRGAPMLGGKGDLTEGGVREPLIVNCPRLVPAGRMCPDLADFTDFLPTVLELAGAPPPPGLKLDGRSLAPQILGRPGRPREWVYAQLGRDYFIADHRFKLYGDGRLVDIGDSPVAEKAAAANDEAARAARRKLSAALAGLRADAAAPAVPGAPLARAPTADERQADITFLAGLGVIESADAWAGRTDRDGAQVATLIVRGAARLGDAADLGQGLAILQREGVVRSAAYWREHAVAGRTCSDDNTARLVHKLAERLRAR